MLICAILPVNASDERQPSHTYNSTQYDAVVGDLHALLPDMKFIGLALGRHARGCLGGRRGVPLASPGTLPPSRMASVTKLSPNADMLPYRLRMLPMYERI